MKKLLIVIAILLMAGNSVFSQIRFVCIGNSISHGKYSRGHTANTSIGDSLWEMSYRFWFWEKIDSAGLNATMVGYHTKYFDQWANVSVQKSRYTGHTFVNNHEAYYGIKSDGFIAGGWNGDGLNCPNFDTRLTGYTPDVALIHIGTNDPDSTAALIDATENNIKSIITKLRAKNPNVTVLLAKLMTGWKGINARVDGIVTAMNTASSRVVAVDMATGFINNTALAGTMTFDWVHPNAIGQKFMAQRWYTAFMGLVNADVTNPGDPTGLAVSNIKATSVDLSWTPSTDNFLINKYNIYVNDVLTASAVSSPCTVTGLTSNTAYTFKIEAVDLKGNKSNKTAGVPATTTGGFNITITVNDGTSPIQSASVTYAAVTKTTNASGVVTFLSQNSGSSAYQIVKKGYVTQSGNFNLTKDTSKTFSLVPDCQITFNVKDGTKTMSGAVLTMNSINKTTDINGKAVFTGFKPGTFTYTLVLKGFKTITAPITFTDDTTLNVAVQPDCQISFIVTDGVKPLEGAEVYFSAVTKTTDDMGIVIYTDMRPATYSYNISLDGYTTITKNLIVKDDTIMNIVLVSTALEQNQSEIAVFPNPTAGTVCINGAEGATLEILDMAGKKCMVIKSVSSVSCIDLGNLADGIYFIRIIQDGLIVNKKIILRR